MNTILAFIVIAGIMLMLHKIADLLSEIIKILKK